jgi:signal transduction histidine kinase
MATRESASQGQAPLKAVPPPRLRTGLLLGAAYLVIAAAVAGSVGRLIAVERETALQHAQQRVAGEARALAEHAARTIGAATTALDTLADVAALRGAAGVDSTLGHLIADGLRDLPQVRSILITDRVGTVVLETGQAHEASHAARWQTVLGQFHIGGAGVTLGRPVRLEPDGELLIPAVMPVPAPGGGTGGTLAAMAISTGYFAAFYREIELPAGTRIVIAHFDGFPLLDYGSAGEASTVAAGDALQAVERLHGQPLVLTLSSPRDEALAGWRATAKRSAAAAAFAIVLIGLVFAAVHWTLGRRREYENFLHRNNQELARKVRDEAVATARVSHELARVSYAISHDLRAPLRAINGFSQALEEDYGKVMDETARGYLRRVRRASTRMGELLDGLIELTYLTRRRVSKSEVDLSAIVIEIAARLAASDPAREVNFDVTHGVKAVADPVLVRSVLNHLLGNAWKFTRHTPNARIAFGVFHDRSEPVYFVDDNGVGFDMSHAGKLFSPFQRLHVEEEDEGAGMGLATVKRIVELHGGRVWADAVPEAGVTVHFTLASLGDAPLPPEDFGETLDPRTADPPPAQRAAETPITRKRSRVS